MSSQSYLTSDFTVQGGIGLQEQIGGSLDGLSVSVDVGDHSSDSEELEEPPKKKSRRLPFHRDYFLVAEGQQTWNLMGVLPSSFSDFKATILPDSSTVELRATDSSMAVLEKATLNEAIQDADLPQMIADRFWRDLKQGPSSKSHANVYELRKESSKPLLITTDAVKLSVHPFNDKDLNSQKLVTVNIPFAPEKAESTEKKWDEFWTCIYRIVNLGVTIEIGGINRASN